MNLNSLSIEVYSSGTTRLPEPDGAIIRAQDLRFRTGYPGGIFLDASFYISQALVDAWGLQGGQRVVFRNSTVGVYEGYIDNFEFSAGEADQGITVNLVGGWAKILMARKWRKVWADTRTSDDAWPQEQGLTATDYDQYDIRRGDGYIEMSARPGTYAANDAVVLKYTLPTGVTAKRVTYDYLFTEAGGDDWEIHVQEYAGSWAVVTAPVDSRVTATTVTAQSHDLTLGANVTALRLVFKSPGGCVVATDAHNIARWTKLCVYTETGTINFPAVAADVVGYLTDLSSYEGYIGAFAAARSLVGAPSTSPGDSNYPSSFGSFDFTTCADILTSASAAGDGNNARWASALLHSEFAPTPDGKPVLLVEQVPALTDWDYSISLDDQNVVAPASITQNVGGISNWIAVRYTDDTGASKYITPDDDATLKDATSISDYGQRDYVLDVGRASQALAISNGKRFLAQYKDPIWQMSGPITVLDSIRTKSGLFVAVSQVRAGGRLRVDNFINDLSGANQGLTFLISSTDYDDNEQSLSITCGPPPDLIFPIYIPMPQNIPEFGEERTVPWEVDPRGNALSPDAAISGGGAAQDTRKTKASLGLSKADKSNWEKGKLKIKSR